MSNYTPTTSEIEDAWCYRYDGEHTGASGEELRGYEAEFNRWLKQVQAEAWDEGKRSGLRQSDWEHGDTPTMYVAVNPYREEQDA